MLISLILLAAAPQDVLAPPLEVPSVERSELARWRGHLRPNEEDLRYARIDWEPTFTEGLSRANDEQKPLLLWLMNGHPLGCT